MATRSASANTNSTLWSSGQLCVDEAVLAETLSHLQQKWPCEGVALWAGPEEKVTLWLPLRNCADNPRTRYAVHPQDWLDALQQVQTQGQQPLALVHSHPTTAAIPSAYDEATWHYPELWCVIVSFAEGTPVWQAYRNV